MNNKNIEINEMPKYTSVKNICFQALRAMLRFSYNIFRVKG